MINKKDEIIKVLLKNQHITMAELEKKTRTHIDTYFAHRKINRLKTQFKIPVNKYMNIQLPKKAEGLSVKKVRMLAHLFCDGWVRKKDFGYKNSNEQLINLFISDVRSVYGNKFAITDDKKKIRNLSIGVKSIMKDLQQYEPFNSLNWRVPSDILISKSKSWKKIFLGAVFDDEGTVDFSKVNGKNYFRRRITMSLLSFGALNDIQKMLSEFGINSKIYKLKKYQWYQLYIGDKSNIKNFSKIVNLHHNKKREKLKQMLRSYVK